MCTHPNSSLRPPGRKARIDLTMAERPYTTTSKPAGNRIWQWMKAEGTLSEGDPRAPWRLFWVAFLVRVAYMTLAHTYRFRPYVDHFQFGWEAGRIARSLVLGHGFANPFASSYLGLTGPTAWVPPAYPFLIAGAFKLFGIYTPASAWMLLAINCLLSAATALAVWEIAVPLHLPLNRRLVRMALGALSRSHAVRRTLGVGDVPHHLPLRVGYRAGAAHARHQHQRTSNLNAG